MNRNIQDQIDELKAKIALLGKQFCFILDENIKTLNFSLRKISRSNIDSMIGNKTVQLKNFTAIISYCLPWHCYTCSQLKALVA